MSQGLRSVADVHRVGDFVVPALLPLIEGDPDPPDIAGPGVDKGHQQPDCGSAVTDGASRVGVDDSQTQQAHTERLSGGAPEIDPVADRNHDGEQVEKEERTSEERERGSLRALVAAAGIACEQPPKRSEQPEQDAERNPDDEPVDQPRQDTDPEPREGGLAPVGLGQWMTAGRRDVSGGGGGGRTLQLRYIPGGRERRRSCQPTLASVNRTQPR